MTAALWWAAVVGLVLNVFAVGVRLGEGTWQAFTWLNLVAAVYLTAVVGRGGRPKHTEIELSLDEDALPPGVHVYVNGVDAGSMTRLPDGSFEWKQGRPA